MNLLLLFLFVAAILLLKVSGSLDGRTGYVILISVHYIELSEGREKNTT